MEIENSRIATLLTADSGQGSAVENQNSGKPGTQPANTSTAGSNADSVSLTGQARQLQALEARIASEPVVDAQRVQTVRTAVENGSFTINPERIADKMISLEQAIIGMR